MTNRLRERKCNDACRNTQRSESAVVIGSLQAVCCGRCSGEHRRKNSKPYLTCQIRGKDIQAKQEEIIRQLWLHRLVNHYKYPLNRLTVEYPITFGQNSSKRADIVVFDADRPTVPYLIVEVKQPTIKGGKDQLKSYTHATGAPLAFLWSNGGQAVAWHRKNPNYFVEIPDIPTVTQTIEDIVGKPRACNQCIVKELTAYVVISSLLLLCLLRKRWPVFCPYGRRI